MDQITSDFHCQRLSHEPVTSDFHYKTFSHGPITSDFKNNKKSQLFLAGNYMFKVNNRKISKRHEICPKLTIKITKQHQFFILMSLLLTLNIFHILF